jgi:hypothetical protein
MRPSNREWRHMAERMYVNRAYQVARYELSLKDIARGLHQPRKIAKRVLKEFSNGSSS